MQLLYLVQPFVGRFLGGGADWRQTLARSSRSHGSAAKFGVRDGQLDHLVVNVLFVLVIVQGDGHVVNFAQVVLDAGLAVRHSAAANEALVNIGGHGHVAMLSAGIFETGKSDCNLYSSATAAAKIEY